METIIDFFNRAPIHTERQKNIDLLKAISILFMVISHTVTMLSNQRGAFLYLFAHDYLGNYFGVAHALMLAMGIDIAYFPKKSPKYFFLRGITLILLGYSLNFFRAGIYCLILRAGSEQFLHSFFLSDILTFAGLSNIAVGLFKKLKFTSLFIFVISVVLSAVGSFVYQVDCGNGFLNTIVGLFVSTGSAVSADTTDEFSGFVFFSWFIFVALGFVLGNIMRKCKNLEKMYRRLMIIGFIVGAIYMFTVNIFKVEFLNSLNSRYAISTLDAIGFIGIDFFLLGIFYYIMQDGKKKHLNFWYGTAKNVLQIYITHWILLGLLRFLFVNILKVDISFIFLYPLGVLLWKFSEWSVRIAQKLFNKQSGKHGKHFA